MFDRLRVAPVNTVAMSPEKLLSKRDRNGLCEPNQIDLRSRPFSRGLPGYYEPFCGQEGAKIASMEAGASTERPRVTARFAT